ncbi:MAG TPA: AAA family ATPase [Trebonia sp.]|nr:AAA family ATPase [Trebonia sp.]
MDARQTSASGLIGRETELALLEGLVTAVTGGRGSTLLVEGEPGIGKSALVHQALAESSCPVFWGTCDELSQDLPFLPLLSALRVDDSAADQRRATIAKILRGETPADPGTDTSAALGEQLLALIIDQLTDEDGAARPAILVIDDIQWADPPTVRLLGRLARLSRQVPLLLIAIMRPVPQRDDLFMLRRAQNDSVRLELAPLPGPAAAELVSALVGGPPDEELLAIAEDAAGNPLYLTELLAALRRNRGVTVTADGVAVLAADPLRAGAVPRSLAAAIASRLDYMSAPTRDILQAATVLGVEFDVADLAVVLARAVPDLVPAIHEACTAGVLTDTGTRLRFRHPLIHRALYESITTPSQAERHFNAARALARSGAPADKVARQLLRASGSSADARPGGPGAGPAIGLAAGPVAGGQESLARRDAVVRLEDWALAWLALSARLLVSQAPQVAERLLRLAVASVPGGSPEDTRLASWLAEALYSLGERADAEQVADRALRQADDPDLRLDLLCTLARCRMLAGMSAESLATLREALASPGLPPRQRARLLVMAARTHCNDGALDAAALVATQGLAVGEETGDAWAVGWALSALAAVAYGQGRHAEAIELYDRGLAVVVGESTLIDLRLLLLMNKANTLACIDQHDDAMVLADQASSLADQAGAAFRASQARNLRAQILFEMGQWDEALTEALTGSPDLKEPTAACCDLGIAALICFHRGDHAAARSHLDAAEPYSARIGARLVPSLVLARSLSHEKAGNLDRALAELTAWLNGRTQEAGQAEDLLADATRLAAQLGHEDIARAVARQAEELAVGSSIAHRQATALYCVGLVERDPARLRAAATRYAAAGRPLQQGRALAAAATLVDAAGA